VAHVTTDEGWVVIKGIELIVNVFVEVAFPHVPLPVAVSVSVTLPALISAALGV
jgi:hypothetical protein